MFLLNKIASFETWTRQFEILKTTGQTKSRFEKAADPPRLEKITSAERKLFLARGKKRVIARVTVVGRGLIAAIIVLRRRVSRPSNV